MTRKEKLIARFRSRPKDFTFDEAVTLLSYFGYQLSNKGKTSGSRVEFVEKTTGHVIGFHKPHPGNVLKPYVMDQISDQLESRGLISAIQLLTKIILEVLNSPKRTVCSMAKFLASNH